MLKKATIVGLTFVLLFVLAACSSQSKNAGTTTKESAKQVDKKVELKVMMWGEPARIKVQEEFNAAFEKKFPNVKVTLDVPAGDYWAKLQTLVAGNAAPDVFFMQEMMTPTIADKNMMEDLRPFAEKDPEFNLDSIYSNLFVPFEFKGGLYAIPSVVYTSLFFYNKDMFDKAHIAYPDDTWTWETYRDAAKKLTIANNGTTEQYGTTINTIINFYINWLFSNGGDLLNEDLTKSAINSPQNIETYQFLHDLIYKDKSAPSPDANKETTNSFGLQTGKVAMEITGSWMIPTFQKVNFNWGIAPLPKSPIGKSIAMAYPNGWSMSPSSTNKQMAWEYIKFAGGEEGQKIMAASQNGMPTNIKLAASPKLKEMSPGINVDTILKIMDSAQGPRTTPRWSEIDTEIIARGTEYIWLNKKPVKETLDGIAEDMNKMLDEINSGK